MANGTSTNAFPVIRDIIQKYDTKNARHTIVAEFFEYRSKEDITALPPGYLVQPSQNVLHNAAGLIYNRPGYTLDGQATSNSNVEDGIGSHYDWITHLGFEQHVRVHNGAIEYRYINSSGAVSWLPLMTNNTMKTWDGVTTLFRFAEYWDTNELIDELLFVNGDGNVYMWGGAEATLASVSSAALTISPAFANTPPSQVITITGSSGLTSFSGSTTTVGNSVLSGTVTYNGVTTVCGYILIPNQPAAGDTITLIINGQSIVITFVNHPYGNLTDAGYPAGSVALGYDWSYNGTNGALGVYVPNLSSQDFAVTRSYLLALFNNIITSQGTRFANFVAFNAISQGQYISLLNINSGVILTGSTTTVGNTVSSSSETVVVSMVNNMANGDTISINYNGQMIVSRAVTALSQPGDFIIGVSASSTLANFVGLVTHPTTTNTTQQAYATNNAIVVGIYNYSSSTGITLQGQQTWAQLGFMTKTAGRGLIIQGQLFNYTGGESTLTLTGVAPDPTTTATPALVTGLPIVQAPMVIAGASITNLPSLFNPNLIACVGNQVFYGSTTRRDFYISQTNNAYNCTVNSPRFPGDGGTLTADSALTGFVVQETTMYASAGPDWWYTVVFGPQQNNSVTISGSTIVTTYEPIVLSPLKTSPGQGAISQEAIFKVKNSVFFITHEPAIDDLGRVIDDLALPEAVTLTDSIKNDFFGYDLTGAHGVYNKYFLYVVLPAEGLMLVRNFFQAWWEPPQIFPFSRLAIIDGKLYAHSSQVPETYRVYIDNPLDENIVYSDNGNPINSIAAFSYQNFGLRDVRKHFTELFIEGYIKANTTLTIGAKYDFGGFSGLQTFSLSGSNQNNLVYTYANNSIGKVPIGKNPVGSITDSILNSPKFRHIFTTFNIDFFEYQFFVQSNDVDQQWQLLADGVDQTISENRLGDIKT